jgi:hypothetical protein
MINVGDTVRIKGQDGEKVRGIISAVVEDYDSIDVSASPAKREAIPGLKRVTLTMEVIAGHGEVEAKPLIVHAMGFDLLDLCGAAPRGERLIVTPVMQEVTCVKCRTLLDRLADQVFVGCKACRDGIPH